MSIALVASSGPAVFRAPVRLAPAPKAAKRVLGFFTAQVKSQYTRKRARGRRGVAGCLGRVFRGSGAEPRKAQ